MLLERDAQVDDHLAVASPARRALRNLVATRAALDLLETHLVVLARLERWSWWSIARDLGVTTSTAFRRHSPDDPFREELDAERRLRAPPDLSRPASPRS